MGTPPAEEARQLFRRLARIVHAVDQGVLEGHTAAGGAGVTAGRFEQVVDRVRAGGRDELLAQHVVRRVQGDGEADLQLLAGQPVDAVDKADGRDRDVALAEGECAGAASNLSARTVSA